MASDFSSYPLAEHGAPCPQCAAAMSGDQRYCLSCGARRGEPRLDPLEAARSPLASQPPLVLGGAAAVAGAAQAQPVGWEGFPLGDLNFGSPRIVGAAVLGLVAVGVVLGVIAGPKAPTTSAAAGQSAQVAADAPAAADSALSAGTLDGTVASTSTGDLPLAPIESGGGGGGVGGGGGTVTPVTPTVTSAAPIKHAWVITLSGPSQEEIYGQAAAAAAAASTLKAKAAQSSYLGTELRSKGTLLSGYRSVSAAALPNSLALISGQAPNTATATNCPKFIDLKPVKVDSKTGLVSGDGCRYPATTQSLAGQLTGAGMVWKGYFESIGNDPKSGVTTCRHPDANSNDPFAAPRPGDGYMTWRNPFVYFRSITEEPECGNSVVGLDRLAPDLVKLEDTPAFSLVAPDACHDGSASSCDGAVGGLAAADQWLQQVVPAIVASKAYADGGMIVITSDHDASKPAEAEAKVGALVISPYVAAGATVTTAYNHYSLLKTIEIAFGVDRLGKAAAAAVKPFDKKVFANSPLAGGD